MHTAQSASERLAAKISDFLSSAQAMETALREDTDAVADGNQELQDLVNENGNWVNCDLHKT